MAVINDFQTDVKQLMKQENVFQSHLADKLGVSQQGISRAIARKQFNDTFVNIMEQLGYDIKVTYIKREKTAEEVLHKGV